MTLRDYIIKFEYNNDMSTLPKCQCGYCNESNNKKYIFILDKNYTDFIKIIGSL